MAHSRLYSDRPGATRLTEFYLWISLGGAIGGLFGALVAPAIFDSIAEYPISIVATAALLTGRPETRRSRLRLLVPLFAILLVAGFWFEDASLVALVVGTAGIVAFLLAGRSAWFAPLLAAALVVASDANDGRVLAQERTFYGVYRITETESGDHLMISGTTIHGSQHFKPTPSAKPLVYYVPEGPTGQLMELFDEREHEIGVIGLGVGSLASYLQTSQRMTFLELDPAVVDLASDPDLFTFLSDTHGSLEFIVGDGRFALDSVGRRFDLLIVDAFSSDAIPVHLLTLEAMETYLYSLSQKGVVAFHVSNRHFDLEPVVARVAVELGLSALASTYEPRDIDGSPAAFVAVARDLADIEPLLRNGDWVSPRIGEDLWTDDYSNLLGALS
jgi:spermidine synthase